MNIKSFSLYGLVIVIVALFLLSGCAAKKFSTKKIEGIVIQVEYIAEGSSFNAADIKATIVRFKDGRVKAFKGISGLIFQTGKWNVITYNKYNRIVSVAIDDES